MTVDEICTREVVVASPQQSVEDASRRMRDASLGTLVVVDPLNRPIGIVTDRDVAVRCVAEGRDPRRTPLDHLMSGPVVWIRSGSAIETALDEMARLRIRRLPVVDERDRLIGILSLDDVLASRTDPASALGRALEATSS